MFGSNIIDVAIGLILVFFLLSVISSRINDLVAEWMQWRSKDLERGVRQLLGDPELADKVWNHPLVRGLSGHTDKKPTNIPPNTFALALFDAVAPGGNHPDALQSLRTEALGLPEGSARRALVSMIDAAHGDTDKARADVATWFDASMGHVSAVYKQRMQMLTFLVAAIVTLVFGADSLAMANSLWQEPALRAAVTGAAFANASLPAGTTQPTVNLPAQSSGVQDTIKALSQFNLPLGWGSLPNTPGGWLQKIVGLILTMAAVSLGAPFWYQLLKQASEYGKQQLAPP